MILYKQGATQATIKARRQRRTWQRCLLLPPFTICAQIHPAASPVSTEISQPAVSTKWGLPGQALTRLRRRRRSCQLQQPVQGRRSSQKQRCSSARQPTHGVPPPLPAQPCGPEAPPEAMPGAWMA